MKWPWSKPKTPPITTIVASCPKCSSTTVIMFHMEEGGIVGVNERLDKIAATAVPKRTASDIVKEKDAEQRVNRRVYDQDHRAQPEV